MKNAAERRAYIENPDNWEPVEYTRHMRLSCIEYKGEKRYKLETFEVCNFFNYKTREPEEREEWVLRVYYKPTDKNNAGPMVAQSVTDLREWLADLDRKGGTK